MQKSDNLNEKAYIKIIDFGLASEVKYLLRNKSGIVGTLNYMAP
jgi:serine/threonine protein kinase